MKNFLVESGTASQAFGAASMKKAKPITALYQTKFSRAGGILLGQRCHRGRIQDPADPANFDCSRLGAGLAIGTKGGEA
jgi:hypothetical protein